jgi:hypothetical protein
MKPCKYRKKDTAQQIEYFVLYFEKIESIMY